MKILVVVQRYGRDVVGGAELATREFATRLAARGHGVDVLTSCAASYTSWENAFAAGTEQIDGVFVHRLPVDAARDERLYSPLQARTLSESYRSAPLHLQETWMRAQGPHVPELGPWIEANAGSYDLAVFFTYLYYTAWAGIRAAAPLLPVILHPTAHDEPPLRLSLFDPVFRFPAGHAFLTPEEGTLVRERFGLRRPSIVTGLGVDLGGAHDSDPLVTQRYGIGDRDFVLNVGRLDPGKGSDELFDFFTAYKRRHPGPLMLVCAGPARGIESPDPDIIVTDVVDERTKRALLEEALALVQPSYFESFSLVLAEAWAQRKPALVNGRCAVLHGQARRGGGAIPYRGYAEFEAALELMVEDPSLRTSLGRAGRAYAERVFNWDAIMDRYDRFLDWIATRAPR